MLIHAPPSSILAHKLRESLGEEIGPFVDKIHSEEKQKDEEEGDSNENIQLNEKPKPRPGCK